MPAAAPATTPAPCSPMWRGSRRSTCRPACSRSPDASSPTPPWHRRAAFHQAPIDDLPLPDGTVDGVIVNQVLHHLPDDPAAGWPAHRRVLRELARVLRPGGVCVINSCSHAQIEQGFWPYHLIPAARAADAAAPDAAGRRSRRRSRRSASRRRGRFVPVDAVLQGARLLRPARPAAAPSGGPAIRSGRWSSEAELAAMQRTLRRARARRPARRLPRRARRAAAARSARSRCSMASRAEGRRARAAAPPRRAPRSRRRAAGPRP